MAYEGGNHAFVSHLSDGVTFRECIAHDQAETPFWWDGAEDHEEPGSVPTNDLVYERCVAHLVHPTTTSRYGVAGFLLGTGRGNIARGCVASGVQANDESSPGFQWTPDSRDEEHTWTFEDCVSHNNNGASLYHWINVVPRTIIDRFTAYHDRHGIRAGAYSNPGVVPRHHRVRLRGGGAGDPDCTSDGNAFWLADPLTDSVAITVRDDVHGALALRPADQAGELREDWNVRVTPA